MDSLLHSIHVWQHAALTWLSTRDPVMVDLVNTVVMTLEGMGVPGIPGELPMLAQAGLIEAGKHSYLHAVVVGTVANLLGSVLGYAVGTRGANWLPRRWRPTLLAGSARLAQTPHAGWLILISRSFGALRTPVTWGAGAGHYPFWPYVGWALAGAIVHIAVWQYALWKGTGWLGHLRPRQLITVAALASIAALGYWLWKIQASRRAAAAGAAAGTAAGPLGDSDPDAT